MKINWDALMIFSGLVLLGFGLFRARNTMMVMNGDLPPTMMKMVWSVAPLIVFLIITIGVGWLRADLCVLAKAGVAQTVMTTASLFPTLVVLMVTMSVGSVVMGHYKKETVRMLTGNHKLVGVYVVALTAPTTSALSLQAKTLWTEAPEARPQIISLMLIASFVSIGLFFFRALGLNWQIAMCLYCTGAFVSIFVYPLVLLYSRVFPYH